MISSLCWLLSRDKSSFESFNQTWSFWCTMSRTIVIYPFWSLTLQTLTLFTWSIKCILRKWVINIKQNTIMTLIFLHSYWVTATNPIIIIFVCSISETRGIILTVKCINILPRGFVCGPKYKKGKTFRKYSSLLLNMLRFQKQYSISYSLSPSPKLLLFSSIYLIKTKCLVLIFLKPSAKIVKFIDLC